MKEKTTTTCTIYPEDLVKVRAWKDSAKQKNLAVSMRALITFASDRGFFA